MEINKIHAYKHDGTLYRVWDDIVVLKETKDYYIFEKDEATRVIEVGSKNWYTRERAILYFSKHSWFNIMVMIKPEKVVYYCNLATPPVIEMDTIKYIDYDLDVKYFSDTKDIVLLDLHEFKLHKKKYNYSFWLENKIMSAKKEILHTIENKLTPFNEKFVERWSKSDRENNKTDK